MFEAKEVILQVSGKAKQDIVKEMYYTNPTEELPGTVLKLLPGGLVVLDQDAAEGIQNLLAES